MWPRTGALLDFRMLETPKRRPGRPPVPDPWDRVTVAFRASDLARVRTIVGGSLSEWIRALVLAELELRNPP